MAYRKPEIRTLDSRTLVEAMGPATALGSGVSDEPDGMFPQATGVSSNSDYRPN